MKKTFGSVLDFFCNSVMSRSKETYSFSEFTLDPAKRKLFRERAEIKLCDKDFDVLLFLISSAPRTCSHNEIIDAVWNQTHVGNGSVDKAINNIRKALSDDSRNPRFIKTIRARGYLFVGDIAGPNNDETEYYSEAIFQEGGPPFDATNDDQESTTKSVGKARAVVGLILVIGLLTAGGFYLGSLVLRDSEARRVVFADDFSSAELDSGKWQPDGKSVKVTDGKVVITIDETDRGGQLWSTYFAIDPSKPLTFYSRLRIDPNKNYGNYNFTGEFFIVPRVFPNEQSGVIDFAMVKKLALAFGVMYIKTEYSSEEQVPTEGFFIIKPGGRPPFKFSQKAGVISRPIDPVWNRWFDQKLVYNPATGWMEVYIDGLRVAEYEVGVFPVSDRNEIQLQITPYGWYTNHSMEIDYIAVEQ